MDLEPILIGITGNIGSGKSKFCGFLQTGGHRVILADAIAQEQLDDPENLKQLVRHWGKTVVKGGKPDRKEIASIVFNNKVERSWLNNLLHPRILVAMQQIVDESRDQYLFFEVPLLFEAGLQHCFDYIVLIRADRDLRLQRLIKNGKGTPEEIEARMDAQIDDVDKIPLCDLVIDNNGSLSSLRGQVAALTARLDGIRRKDKIPFAN